MQMDTDRTWGGPYDPTITEDENGEFAEDPNASSDLMTGGSYDSYMGGGTSPGGGGYDSYMGGGS